MIPITASAQVTGLDEAFAQLADLTKALRGRILRGAMAAGGRVAARMVKDLVPVEVGTDALSRARSKTMKRSIGIKVVTRNGVVIVIVGPRRGFKKQVGVRTRGKAKGQPVCYDPVKVFHLIERGSKGTRAFAPLRRTLASGVNAIGAAIIEKIQAGLEREAQRASRA